MGPNLPDLRRGCPPKPRRRLANLDPRISDPVFGRNLLTQEATATSKKGRRKLYTAVADCCRNPEIRISGIPQIFPKKSLIRRSYGDRLLCVHIVPETSAPVGQFGTPNFGPRWPKPARKGRQRRRKTLHREDPRVGRHCTATSVHPPLRGCRQNPGFLNFSENAAPQLRNPNFRISQFLSGKLANPRVGPRSADFSDHHCNLGPRWPSWNPKFRTPFFPEELPEPGDIDVGKRGAAKICFPPSFSRPNPSRRISRIFRDKTANPRVRPKSVGL